MALNHFCVSLTDMSGSNNRKFEVSRFQAIFSDCYGVKVLLHKLITKVAQSCRTERLKMR